jgi:cytochrome c2
MRRMVLGLAIAAMLGGHAMAQADAITPPIAPLLATADPAAGESYAKKVCAQCHSLNEGGKAIIGPNLYGVVGGPHAHMPGFNYSDAMKAKQGPWTYDELFAWLTKQAGRIRTGHAHGVPRYQEREAPPRRNCVSTHVITRSGAPADA